MALPRSGAEDGPILQLADDALETSIGLDGHVLRVFVADGAEMTVQFADGNEGAAQAAWRFRALSHAGRIVALRVPWPSSSGISAW